MASTGTAVPTDNNRCTSVPALTTVTQESGVTHQDGDDDRTTCDDRELVCDGLVSNNYRGNYYCWFKPSLQTWSFSGQEKWTPNYKSWTTSGCCM